MTNTDSGPFIDIIPAISLRENERGVHIGNGWDPQWHQPTDVYATYTDKDFRLGARLSNASRAPSSRASRGRIREFRPFFAGGAGLLGACSHFSDTLLGLNAAQTTLGAVAGLTGATLKK